MAEAEVGGEVRSFGVIANRAESVRRLVGKLGKPESLKVCYEADPTGYVLYWQLSELGVRCEVAAATLVPVKAEDRAKTDRSDAEELARCYRAGDLTAVWVPDAAHEALRDLVRAWRPNAISCERATDWVSSCCARRGVHRRAPRPGRASIWAWSRSSISSTPPIFPLNADFAFIWPRPLKSWCLRESWDGSRLGSGSLCRPSCAKADRRACTPSRHLYTQLLPQGRILRACAGNH